MEGKSSTDQTSTTGTRSQRNTNGSATDQPAGSDRGRNGTKTVYIDNEAITIDKDTTAAELKEIANVADNEYATYRQDGEPLKLNDDDYIFEWVPHEAVITFQQHDTGGRFG